MEAILQKLREAYQEAKQQQTCSNPTLQDIMFNPQNQEFRFVFGDKED